MLTSKVKIPSSILRDDLGAHSPPSRVDQQIMGGPHTVTYTGESISEVSKKRFL